VLKRNAQFPLDVHEVRGTVIYNPSCWAASNNLIAMGLWGSVVIGARMAHCRPLSCRRKYVREEALEVQFTELFGRLRFDDEVLAWVREALHASHADQRRDHQEAVERLRAEHKRKPGLHQTGQVRVGGEPILRGDTKTLQRAGFELFTG
jgi:hypothetical protein